MDRYDMAHIRRPLHHTLGQGEAGENPLTAPPLLFSFADWKKKREGGGRVVTPVAGSFKYTTN